MNSFRWPVSTLAFAITLLWCASVFAQDGPRSPIKLSLLDEQMRPVAGVALSGYFDKTVEEGGFLMFKDIVHKSEAFNCVTDPLGECALSAPIDFTIVPGGFQRTGYRINGSLATVAIEQLQGVNLQKASRFYAQMAYAGEKSELINLRFFLKGRTLRPTHYPRMPALAAVLGEIKPVDTPQEIQFTSNVSHSLWDSNFGLGMISAAYMQARINKASGEVRFDIVASNAELSQLSGVELLLLRSTENYKVIAGTGGTARVFPLAGVKFYDHNRGMVVQQMHFMVAESDLRNMVKDYVEGSDGEFAFEIQSLDKIRIRRAIPYFEIVAMLARSSELRPEKN